MQSQFQQEQSEAERRYRPETVQKAAALAARLQEERRGLLSQAEVDELAAEIGIDPKLMRQALNAVAHTETPVKVSRAERRSKLLFEFLGGSAVFGVLTFFVLVFLFRSYRATPPVLLPSPVSAGTLSSGPLIANGDFEAGATTSTGRQKLARGSRSLSGWTIEGGDVSRLTDTAGNHAIRLGESGRIQQIFRTVPGQIYRVSFSLSGEPGEVGRLHRLQVEVGNTSTAPSLFTEPGTGHAAKWDQTSFNFVAEEAGTRIVIAPGPNDGTGPGIPIIDNLRVEPANFP